MKSYGQYCALARALDRIGDRWTLLIIRELLIGPRRYSDIRAAVPAIATNLLARRLQELEAEGIVSRRRLDPPAAATVYELTDIGRGLEPAVLALIRWGGRWMGEKEPDQAFRPEWLALALKALIPAEALQDVDFVCKVELQGQDLKLRFSPQGVEALNRDAPPDVEIETTPGSLLEVVVGSRSLAAAVEEGRVAVRGDGKGLSRLSQVLSRGPLRTEVG